MSFNLTLESLSPWNFIRCIVVVTVSSVLRIPLNAFKVIGTATAINLLIPKIPLVGAAAISIADTLFILLFYRQDGSLRRLRLFEAFVSVFVIAIFIMFCIELSLISPPPREVFRGFLPSRNIFVSDGLVFHHAQAHFRGAN
jgi:metal iron transporter